MNHCVSSYAVSYEDMVQNWIEQFHPEDCLVIIYDPLTHIDFLRQNNIEVDEQNMFSSKVLILNYFEVLDILRIVDYLSVEEGPYAQAWAQGVLLKETY